MNHAIENSTAHLLESLTDAQRDAVRHLDGPQLILAGPGSGKTRVVTHRIAHLMSHGRAPWQILGLTFTNKAADEMRARLDQLAPGKRVWISTFHRFCARVLRQYSQFVGLEQNYTIYDTRESGQLLRAVMEELGLTGGSPTPDQIASAISSAKSRLVSADQYTPQRGSPLGSIVAEVYPQYQSRLVAANAVDFDDLLLHVAGLLRSSDEVRRELDERHRYILVDEYQDTNLAQYAIIRALSTDHPNLSVTGDPDQAIYGWRGANLGNILDFEHDYPDVQVVRLEQNYRSTKAILRAADALISHNVKRKKKDLYTNNEEGAPVRYVQYPSQKEEAGAIASAIAEQVRAGRRSAGDFAVLYRTNALSRELEHTLADEGVPYQILNSVEFYQRKEIKDVMAYLQLVHNPRSEVALRRVINTPARGIGRTTLARLTDHAARYGMSLLEAARESGLIESLTKRAAVSVAKFVAIFDAISEHAAAPVEEILSRVLSESGYAQSLEKGDSEQDQERLANVQELITAARQFDEQNPEEGPLEAFLEQASLVSDTDGWESQVERVTLMTMHSAKGLEFPVVFVVAVEHGLLPHERSLKNPASMEEERRLLFVSITRAQQQLQLTSARQRDYRGQRKYTIPSSFLEELPTGEMEIIDSSSGDSFHEQPRYEVADSEPKRRSKPTRSSSGVTLTTAAALASAGASEPGETDAADFREGMLVKHPEYGIGKITAIDGDGDARKATVSFVTGAGKKRFVLAKSNLIPLAKS